MRVCSYPKCAHKQGLHRDCKQHKLPSDQYACRTWLRNCKIAGTPRKLPAAIYICSCHFVGGKGPTAAHPFPGVFEPTGNLNEPYKMKSFRPNLSPVRVGPSNIHETQDNGKDREERVDEPLTPQSSSESRRISPRTPKRDGLATPKVSSTGMTAQFTPPVDQSQRNEECNTPLCSTQNNSFSADPTNNIESYDVLDTPQAVRRRGGAPMDSFEEHFKTLSVSPAGSGQQHADPLQLPTDIQKLNYNLRKRKRIDDSATIPEEGEIDEIESRSTKLQCNFPLFSYERSKEWSESDFIYFTSLSRASFDIVFNLFEDDGTDKIKYKRNRSTPSHSKPSIHSTKSKLFVTLVRLRRGFSLRDMKMMFGMSEQSISETFTAWVRMLSIKFKSMENAIFVSAAAQQENAPDCYKPFPNLRCVVDTTDIKIQKPDNMEQQSNTFSKYKSGNIHKFVVATSLYGGLSFISEGIEGNASDRKLFLQCGIMDHLQPGDAVMTDRGFDIEADLNEIEVDFLVPPFLGERETFTAREVILGKAIASSRIHVETFIGRLKFFKLVRNVMPNTMSDILSDVVRVCANLINFSDPFIKWNTAKSKKSKSK